MVEGDKMARELLLQSNFHVDEVYALASWAEDHQLWDRLPQSKVTIVSEAELHQISTLTTPNQVLAVVDQPEVLWKEQTWSDWVLYLDGIQDPGNMGSILRIADWFGLHPLFCSPTTVEVYNPKVVQASMGAFLRVPVTEVALEEIANFQSDRAIWGADLSGQNAFSASWPDKGILVIGSEGTGLQVHTKSHLHEKVTIPKGKEGGAESLNAAVATGILCAACFSGK